MVNATLQALARGKFLGDELRALEERAGIAKKVEDAQLGPLIPNLEATPDEYFRETEDYARRKVRKLYFGVEDLDLRKALIAKRRECERMHADHLNNELRRAQQALAKAQRRVYSLPWAWAGCLAVIWVAAGAALFQLYGAIAGALVGFFSGQGVIARARSQRTEEVRAAQAEVDEELQGVHAASISPVWFNAGEERTGECDESFNHESVIANFYAAQREGSSKQG